MELAPNFHTFWGPVLMVDFTAHSISYREAKSILQIAYACLSTTLLLTVLVSILATRFADINRDAIEEHMFRTAVEVFEGKFVPFRFPQRLTRGFTMKESSRTPYSTMSLPSTFLL
jgi:hypothetical protein